MQPLASLLANQKNQPNQKHVEPSPPPTDTFMNKPIIEEKTKVLKPNVQYQLALINKTPIRPRTSKQALNNSVLAANRNLRDISTSQPKPKVQDEKRDRSATMLSDNDISSISIH